MQIVGYLKMANNNNQLQTFLFNLELICSNDDDSLEMVNRVKDEFRKYGVVDSDVKDPQGRRINKLLRISRAMETSMEAFLTKHHNCPTDMRKHTMGGYMNALYNPAVGTHSSLPSHVYAQGCTNRDSITDKRNKYLHQAGKYPSPNEVKHYFEDVLSFLAVMITLT